MLKTKIIATLATAMIGSTGVVAHAMPSNTSKSASIIQNSNLGVENTGQTINFDGVHSRQHFQFAQDLYPNFQSQMYTASNGDVAYCLDNGLFGAGGGTNYQNTNKTVSPEVHYILSEGYDGTQASIQKFTNWEGYGFNAQQAYEITQLAIWASNDANPACRVDLNQLYYSNITGKAIIQAAQKLFNQAQNASNTLSIEGSISNITYNGGYQYIGPFKVNAGEPISSYKVNLSGSANAVAVSSIGGQVQDSFNNGDSFYIKVTPSDEITHVNLNVTAKSTLHDAVIQSTYRNYYQNYANGESGYVNLVNSKGFDVPVPHALIVHREHKPTPKTVTPKTVTPNVTNNNVNKPSNDNEQHQSQTQTVNNKPVVKDTNTASPKDTNKDEQHQSTNVNNHPSTKVDNKPVVKDTNTASPKNANKGEQHQSTNVNNHPSINNHPTNSNRNNITVSPNQSPNQSNHDSFSPIIKINIYNDNNNSNSNSNSNSNANANGNGSKVMANSNSNSNTGNGSAKVKSDVGNKSVNNNSNANSNSNVNSNANSNSSSSVKADSTSTAKAGADSSSAKVDSTSTVKGDTAKAKATGIKAKVETSVNGVKKEVKGDNVQVSQGTSGQSVSDKALPHTGLTAGQNPLQSADIALGTAGILASILGVFGLRKLLKK